MDGAGASSSGASDRGAADEATGYDATTAFHPDHRVRSTWTSDLSVAEAAAVRRIGMVPAGFVMGTAVVQLAAAGSQLFGQWASLGGVPSSGGYSEPFPCAHGYGFTVGQTAQEHYGFNVEDTRLADSLSAGYGLALDRLVAEAGGLGAHGVVGVELSFENLVGSQNTATFFARGTAVVVPGTAALAEPFLTNASGQHLERLIALGYVPAGMAVGVGAVYVHPNCLARGNLSVVGPNRQIPEAMSVARERARAALAATAHRRGEGVVHTEWRDRKVNRYGESWDQLTVAFGTAVRRYRAEAVPEQPRPVVPLRP